MKIFIGYDSKQAEASKICEFSLRHNSSVPLDIYHLDTNELRKAEKYFRADGDPSSTEFTYSRFLVPHLMGYEGFAMFVDSDFLFLDNITKLWDQIILDKINWAFTSAWCVQHPEYTPKSNVKFYNKPQLTFPKKNWSSLMIFNCQHPDCKKLTPITVSNQSPRWLHRFEWTMDNTIGNISTNWNFLVGEYEHQTSLPHALHFTNGGPFNDVWGQDYEEYWLMYKDKLNSLAELGELQSPTSIRELF